MLAQQLIYTTPAPIPQLLLRVLNASSALDLHNAAYYLAEGTLKLMTAAAVAEGARYLDEAPSSLAVLEHASVGHWCGLLREHAHALAERDDAVGERWARVVADGDRPALLKWASAARDAGAISSELTRRIGRASATRAFATFAAYRNAVLGHGAQREAAYYEEIGPLLRDAVCELIANSDLLVGASIVAPVFDEAGEVVRWRRLSGPIGLPGAPVSDDELGPGAAYLVTSDGSELPLHPLVAFVTEEQPQREFVAFVNRVRHLTKPEKTRVELLDFETGKVLVGGDPDGLRALIAAGQERVGRGRPPERVEAPATNLGRELTSFVGRSRERAELRALLTDGASVVTVLGPGGMGKTRLTREVGRTLVADYPGGVWFCDLASATDVDGIAGVVADVLGVPSGRDPVEAVGRALEFAAGPTLLLMDNFEQAVSAAAETVGRWLAAHANLQVAATSRELLGVPGEVTFPLRPFDLPPLSDESAWQDNSAIELFVERARQVQSNFRLDANDALILRKLVTRLDGLPLAIELAAARVRLMPPNRILDRLGRRFELLADSRRSGERHGTLHNAIQWSWDLLEPWEQSAMIQLSVFAGGFTLEAAEAVVDLSEWPDAPWVFDVVQSLLDKSLVYPDRSGVGDRLSMLVSIQEFAAHAAHDLRDARTRHARYFAARFSDVKEQIVGPRHKAVMDELGSERENLARGVRAAAELGLNDVAAGCWFALAKLLQARGPYHRITETSVGIDRHALSPYLRWWVTATLFHAGAVTRADVLALFDELIGLEDDPVRRLQRQTFGMIPLVIAGCSAEEVRAVVERVEAEIRIVGDHWACGDALHTMAVLFVQLDVERAFAISERSIEMRRRIGNVSHIAMGLPNHAELLHALRQDDEALAVCEEAHEVATELDHIHARIRSQVGLAQAQLLMGSSSALEVVRRVVRLGKLLGQNMLTPVVHSISALVEAWHGDAMVARASADALRRSPRRGSLRFRTTLALVNHRLGDPGAVEELEALREEIEALPTPTLFHRLLELAG